MNVSVVPPQPVRWLTWGRLVAITLIVMLVGIVSGWFVIGRFGLFAPPLLPYTVLIYLLLWLPVFIIGLLMRPHSSRKPLLLLVALGVVITVIGLVILGTALNYTSGTCQPAPLAEQSVRYECLSATNYQNARAGYVLEGSTGSPFVWVVTPPGTGE